jgi:cytochrome c oxidase subunit 2
MPSKPGISHWACAIGLAALSASAQAAWQLDLTPGVTAVSQEVHAMHRTMLYWCVAIGIVVFGAMFYSMIVHRKARGYKAATFHESTTIEIVWTIIPFLILIAMAIPATKTLINMADTSDAPLTVKVTGSRWKWHYEYLSYEGQDSPGVKFLSVLTTPPDQFERPKFAAGLFPSGGAKDRFKPEGAYPEMGEHYNMEVDNPLVVPAGQKVRMLITSDDVIHSWSVMDFGVKRDAIPGFINEIWFNVPEDKPGIYRGFCTELCGKDHAYMPIVVEVKSQADFKTWLASTAAAQKKAAEEAANSIDKVFTKEELLAEGEQGYLKRCSACHQANGQGLPPTFPSIVGSKVATGPVADHVHLVVAGKNMMPAFGNVLSPREIAAILTYQRNAWGNKPSDGVDIVQPRDIVK